MSALKNSTSNSGSKSIYDITHKIEEELTYIYEMRMKQYVNSSAKKEAVSEKNNEILKKNQTVSLFAR